LPTDQLSIKLEPSTPGANETVIATAESFSTDLNRATLTWRVNGTLIEQGLGRTQISFTTGSIGKTTTVSLSASLAEGTQAQKTLSITPADVDLILESNSYTHPFYKGKSLPPPNSTITLIAVPHFKTSGGARLNERNLIYTWSDTGKTLGPASGTGKNTLTVTGPQIFRNKTYTVTVRSQDGSLVATRSLTVAPSSNTVHMYEAHPLLGALLEMSLFGSVPIRGSEMSVLVEPYHFSTTERTSTNVQYSWSLNGSRTDNPGNDMGIMTLRPSGTGYAVLGVQLNGVTSYLENASSAVTLTFNAE
jgi:hypothetical protein